VGEFHHPSINSCTEYLIVWCLRYLFGGSWNVFDL